MTFRAFLAGLIAFSPASLFADEWQILGSRAMGMGGAGVAMADGAVAQYWNPAALAETDNLNSSSGFQMPVGARVEFTGGVLNDANTLGDLASQFSAIQSAQKSGTPGAVDATTLSSFYKGLVTISDMNQPGKGILANVGGGANFKFRKFAFSMNNFTSLGASPFIDTTNIGLGASGSYSGVKFTGANTAAPGNATDAASATQIANAIGASGYTNLNAVTGGALAAAGIANQTQLGNALVNFAKNTNGQTSQQIADAANQIAANAPAASQIIANAASGNPYTNNQSNLTIRGGSFTELAMGYGRPVLLPGLNIGGNLKVIVGRVAYARFNVLQNSSGSNPFKNYSTAQSVRPGIDLGALWHLDKIVPVLPWKPRVGLVGRNLNNPSFSTPGAAVNNGDPNHYNLNPQIRMGAAISPLNWWHVAADLDLTQNNTPVQGFHSRQFGLGTEINVFNRTWINIPLRAGLMNNIAESASKLGYTAGFGLHFLHFAIDAAGAISSDETQIKSGQKLPSNASVAIQLGLMF